MMHERTDPPVNRRGERVNDDYLSPACANGLDNEGCVSAACCCSCHAVVRIGVDYLVQVAATRLDWDVEEIAAYPLNRDVLRTMAEAVLAASGAFLFRREGRMRGD